MKKSNKYLVSGLNGQHIKHLKHNTLIDAQMFRQAVKETTDRYIIVIDSKQKRRAIKIENIKNILQSYVFLYGQFYVLCYHKGIFTIKPAVQGITKEVKNA